MKVRGEFFHFISNHLFSSLTSKQLKDQLADDPAFKALDKLDSLTVFEDHMVDLDHKEEEETRMERDRQKRESRKARDAFRV